MQNDEKVVSKRAKWSNKELVSRQAGPDDHGKECGLYSDFNGKLLKIVNKKRETSPNTTYLKDNSDCFSDNKQKYGHHVRDYCSISGEIGWWQVLAD